MPRFTTAVTATGHGQVPLRSTVSAVTTTSPATLPVTVISWMRCANLLKRCGTRTEYLVSVYARTSTATRGALPGTGHPGGLLVMSRMRAQPKGRVSLPRPLAPRPSDPPSSIPEQVQDQDDDEYQ